MEGDGGGETGRKGAGGVREAGEEEREVGEKAEIMQHCAIFCN